MRIVNAINFVRKMRGGTQAHLLKGSDGLWYVTKFQNNPQGRRALVNEFLSVAIMRHIGIPTPDAALIRVSADFLRANPEACIFKAGTSEAPLRGLHFGSLYPGPPQTRPVYDFVPDPLLSRVGNLYAFTAALVFDKWAANVDGRQSVFFRPPMTANSPSENARCWLVHMIDNGHAFGYDWKIRTVPLHGTYRNGAVYRGIRSMDDFEPWLQSAMQFPEPRLWRTLSQLPPEWLTSEDIPVLKNLIAELCLRRSRIPEVLQSVRQANPALFPNWQGSKRSRSPKLSQGKLE